MSGIAGVILAGGRSARMGGGDKFLRPLAGKPLLAHVIEHLRPQVDALAINANTDPARLESFGLPVIPDTLTGMGPLGGVLAALRWAQDLPRGYTHVATVACDTPFFPRDLVTKLRAAADASGSIVQALSSGRVHPTFALWPVSLAGKLEAFLQNQGAASMRAFAGGHHPAVAVDFAPEAGQDPFFNINTPTDLEAAEQMAGKAPR